jgi:hypothetical protein
MLEWVLKKIGRYIDMSKWINKELFEEFQSEKIEEKDTEKSGGISRANLWPTPQKGSTENPKVYEGRFVPDAKGNFYKRFYYHMWQATDESWIFVLCPKTHDFKDYCPFCSVTNKLYAGGTTADKAQAYHIKRKEKFVGNWFVVKDPRDEDKEAESKVAGKVKLYEFPGKVEQKLKKEITDKKEGYGLSIFDPGENGRNFIIRVLATKKDDKGKQWPDYSNSSFARSHSPIADTEEKIDAIMETTTDLDAYISNMEVSKHKMVEILKNEFLWEMVSSEAVNQGFEDDGSEPEPKKQTKKPEPEKTPPPKEEDSPKEETKKAPKEEPKDEPPWETDDEEKKEEVKEEVKEEPKAAASSDEDDDALLAELEDL